jgi:hypothetical protein
VIDELNLTLKYLAKKKVKLNNKIKWENHNVITLMLINEYAIKGFLEVELLNKKNPSHVANKSLFN